MLARPLLLLLNRSCSSRILSRRKPTGNTLLTSHISGCRRSRCVSLPALICCRDACSTLRWKSPLGSRKNPRHVHADTGRQSGDDGVAITTEAMWGQDALCQTLGFMSRILAVREQICMSASLFPDHGTAFISSAREHRINPVSSEKWGLNHHTISVAEPVCW